MPESRHPGAEVDKGDSTSPPAQLLPRCHATERTAPTVSNSARTPNARGGYVPHMFHSVKTPNEKGGPAGPPFPTYLTPRRQRPA